jgi:hypothetical protein
MFPARVLSPPAFDDLSPTRNLGIELSFRNVSEAEDPYSVRDVADTDVHLKHPKLPHASNNQRSAIRHSFEGFLDLFHIVEYHPSRWFRCSVNLNSSS